MSEAATDVARYLAEEVKEVVEEVSLVSRDAVVLTVASATGGCGKTFFATNLAAMAGKGRDLRVLIVDLDLQFGEVAAALQLRPQYSIYDGLYGAKGKALPDEAFDEHFDELVVHHPLGFDVLTAPRDPALSDYVGARDADRVLDIVSQRYDIIVVDTPPSLNEVVLTALDRSDLVVVMATLDVPSLKNLSVFLDTVRRLKIDDSRMRLILNKVDRDVGIDVKQAQETFNNRFVGTIAQSRAVSRAMNIGNVVVETEPRSKVSRQLLSAVTAVLPPALAPKVAEETEGGWLARLLSLLRGKGGDK